MARSQYSEVVTFIESGTLKPANNARVSVYLPGTTTLVTIYTTRSAGTTKANPFTTDASGAAEFWAEHGDYDIKYEDLEVPSRFGTKTFGWQSVSGTAGALPFAAFDAAAARQFVPVGTVVSWWRPNNTVSLPTGWALCAGQSVASGDHDFGTGASITMPDLRNKFVLGANSDLADAAAATAGDAATNAPGIRGTGASHARNLQHSHTISAESPGTNSAGSHSHTILANAHDVAFTSLVASGSAVAVSEYNHTHGGGTDSQGAHTHTVNSHSHGGATGNQLGTAQDIKPAYVGLLQIMKIKRN
jgi:hypothetical protein